MSSLNQVCLIARLGRDPEIRSLNNGDRVANLSVVTSEKWKDRQTGEPKERSEWHRITIWGNLVDIVERFLKKGSQVYLQGKLETRKWTDNSGQDKYTTEVVLRPYRGELVMLDERNGGRDSGRQEPARAAGPAHDYDDEIPF